MIRSRAYRTKLDPTQAQAVFFGRCAGVARYVYNWALADRKTAWEERKEHINKFEQKRRFNALKYELCPFVTEVPYVITEQVFENIDWAFQNFFRRVRQGGEAPGFPRFKSRDRTPGHFTLRGSIRVTDAKIKLPILGWVRLAEQDYLPKDAKILSAGLRERAGNWYVALQVQEEVDAPTPPTGEPLGVDMGYGVLAVTSDGDVYANPNTLAQYEKKMTRLQKELSRRQKGGANRKKTKQKIARLHAKVANIREHHLHNTSRWIVDKQSKLIAVEGFNVRKMMQDDSAASQAAGRAKRLADASIGELRRQLAYKQKWNGGQIYEAPSDAATNRTCSTCGFVKNNVPPAWDTWVCDNCNTEHNRRLNSARNVLKLAKSA